MSDRTILTIEIKEINNIHVIIRLEEMYVASKSREE